MSESIDFNADVGESLDVWRRQRRSPGAADYVCQHGVRFVLGGPA
jgi:hypothetical protein